MPKPGKFGEEPFGSTFLRYEMADNLHVVWGQVMHIDAVGLDFAEGGSVHHVSLELFVLGKQRQTGEQQHDPQPTLHSRNPPSQRAK
jgi:hypothetical protein